MIVRYWVWKRIIFIEETVVTFWWYENIVNLICALDPLWGSDFESDASDHSIVGNALHSRNTAAVMALTIDDYFMSILVRKTCFG